MVFSSPVFLFIFLPFVLFVHTILKPSYRNIFLLISSLFFYAWGELYYVSIMMASIVISYFGGTIIDKYLQREKLDLAKWILFLFISIDIIALIYFKYSYFLVENLNLERLFSIDNFKSIHLPLGISFFTFHTISYVIDVYHKKVMAQKNFINHALYVTLFPQLVAGPIVRYRDISKQIYQRIISSQKFYSGILRFCTGLMKKILIANPMAIIADTAFNNPIIELSSAEAWLGIIAYSLQIYFDFSGYSDMAIGLGRMLGFDFLENFNYPYMSKSIQEFWRIWHISLSSWFRDYVFIPLGGSRGSSFEVIRNIGFVFLLTGIWHGANWTFLFWGAYHGVFVLIEKLGWARILAKLPKFIQHLYLCFVVMIGWVFFRVDFIHQGFEYIAVMFNSGNSTSVTYMVISKMSSHINTIFIVGIIFCTPIRKRLFVKLLTFLTNSLNLEFSKTRILFTLLNNIFIAAAIYLCAMELASSTYNPFIYFRF